MHSRFKFSPVQSGLLVFYPTSKMFQSLRLYANSRKYACSEYSASLQLNWFHKNVLVNSPSFSFLTPRCRLVFLALLLLLPSSLSVVSFVLPSSIWIWIFLLSIQGVPPVLAWSSVRTAASLHVPDASMERGEPHFHPPLCHLVHPHLCTY